MNQHTSNPSKRQARVMAMQLLYSMEISDLSVVEALPGVLESLDPKTEQKKYGMDLVDIILEHSEKIISLISEHSINWDINRIAVLDTIILKVAIAELLFIRDVPPKVAISEAIAIAKKYSTEDSGNFINGVLGAVAKPLFNDHKQGDQCETN